MRFKARRSWLRLLGSVVLFGALGAQEIRFDASVDRTRLGIDDPLVLTLRVSGEGVRALVSPTLPELPDFDVTRTSSSTSTQITMIGSQVKQEETIDYVHYLRPKRVGTLTIGPAMVQGGGMTYTTRPIQVEVVEGSLAKSGGSPPSRTSPRGREPADIEGNVFLRVYPSKTKAYVGEQVTLEYWFYTRLDISGLDFVEVPSYAGFWSESLYDARSLDFERKTVDGIAYNAALLKRMALFPVRSGELRVDAMKLKAKVTTSRGFFDFFGRTQEMPLSSGSITFHIDPLPTEGVPEDFAGAVGTFEISAGLDRDTSESGEPIELTVEVSGTGNIRVIERPSIPELADLRTLDPEVTDHVRHAGNTIKGSKTFKFPLIPAADGKHRIPSIGLTFFDPRTGDYVTRETTPLEFVARGAGPAAAVRGPGQGLRVLGGDIRHIKADARSLSNKGTGVPLPLLMLYPLGFLILLLAVGYRRHQTRMIGDQAYARRLRSGRAAKGRLSHAQRLLSERKTGEFYSALARVILGYAGDRFNIEASALTRDELGAALAERDVPDEVVQQLKDLLRDCDEGSYAPGSREENASDDLRRARDLMNRLGRR
jgi:hypothetical protein